MYRHTLERDYLGCKKNYIELIPTIFPKVTPMNNNKIVAVNDDNIDNHVDEKIETFVRDKKNFFMFAGAGSGKTRSLVNTLNFIARTQGETLQIKNKKVAVITYTNAACDEILRRVGYNPLFAVSTIHSFLWELIKPFQKDIKIWVRNK